MNVLDLWANSVRGGGYGFCGLAGRSQIVHAVTPDAILRLIGHPRRTTFDAPCGARVRIWTGDIGAYTWPPRPSLLPDEWTRCRECHEATGRRRPSKEWA